MTVDSDQQTQSSATGSMSDVRGFASLVRDLRRALPHSPVYGGEEAAVDFERFNVARGVRPAARVECASEADVVTTVRLAAAAGLPLSVVGGGNDVAGRTANASRLAVDLRGLRRVSFDASRAQVTVEGGATVADTLAGLPPDQVVPMAANSGVGMVGLATGGGYGYLVGRFGLTCDVMIGARVALADGTIVDASPAEHGELLWALRGGGTSFGIVTSMTFETHRLDSVLSGNVIFDLDHAAEALRVGQLLLGAEPEYLSVLPIFVPGPDGAAVLALTYLWSGDHDAGEIVAGRIATLPGAQLVARNRTPYRDTISADPELWPRGQVYVSQTCDIERIDGDGAAALVDGARAMGPQNSILFAHDFHGYPTTVAATATAFTRRRDHFVVLAAGHAEPGDDGSLARPRAWTRDAIRAFGPSALPGGYVNFLGPQDTARVEQSYGAGAGRLRGLRAQLDPTGMFATGTGAF